MKRGETNTIISNLFWDHIEDIKKNVNYYSTISKDSDLFDRIQLERVKLKSQLIKVGLRNSTLAKYLFLKASYQILRIDKEEYIKEFESFKPKRGRKTNEYVVPIRYIMKVLKCSRRMAIVYSQALATERMIDQLFNMQLGLFAYQTNKKGEG